MRLSEQANLKWNHFNLNDRQKFYLLCQNLGRSTLELFSDEENYIICRGAENIEDVETVAEKETTEQPSADAEKTQAENVQKPVENAEGQDKEHVDNVVDNHEQNIEKLDKIDYSKYEQMIKSIKEDASC